MKLLKNKLSFSAMVLILNVMSIPLLSQHDIELIYKNDTTELEKPIRKGCNHVYINEEISNSYSGIEMSCTAGHDECGCPLKWKSYKAICEICLRHIQIKQNCEVKYFKKDSKYNKLLKWIENK